MQEHAGSDKIGGVMKDDMMRNDNNENSRTGMCTSRKKADKKLKAKRTVAIFVALIICMGAFLSFPLSGLAQDGGQDIEAAGLQADVPETDDVDTTAGPASDEEADPGVETPETDDGQDVNDNPDANVPESGGQDGASVASVPEDPSGDEETYYTVIFEANGVEHHRDEVLEGTLVPMPQNPTGETRFLAWFEEGEDIPFNPAARITKDTKLIAVFSEQHVVKFMDTDGSLLRAVVVENGETVSESFVTPTIPMGRSLAYWQVAGLGGIYNFSNPVHSNLILEPVLNSRARCGGK
jgi:hypothetical protein